MENKKILITGGCGFVGGNIARHLAKNNDVTCIDDMRYRKLLPERLHKMLYPEGCRVIEGDIFKAIGMECDVLIHAATVNIIDSMSNPKGCVDVNWNSTVALFDSIPRTTQLMYLSTSSVYGNAVLYPTPEVDRISATSYYAMTKYMAEMYLRSIRKDACILRLSNVYGPLQMPHNPYAGVIGKVLRAAIKNDQFIIYGDGHDTRDYTYVTDVVNAVELALDKHLRGVYNVGTGIETSVNNLTWMAEVDNVIQVEPRSIDNIKRRCIDAKLLAMDTGWKPEVKLDLGLELTRLWMENNGIFDK